MSKKIEIIGDITEVMEVLTNTQKKVIEIMNILASIEEEGLSEAALCMVMEEFAEKHGISVFDLYDRMKAYAERVNEIFN